MNDNKFNQEKLRNILNFTYEETKNYKTVNSTAVQKIINKMKEELKESED